jgi:hypothetical protein
MIDQHARATALVKEALHKNALGEHTGYSVCQAFAPMQSPDGQIGLMFSWVVTVTLENILIGYDDFAFPVVIPSQVSMPSDKAFTESAVMALEKVREMRDEAMRGDAVKVIPGELAA